MHSPTLRKDLNGVNENFMFFFFCSVSLFSFRSPFWPQTASLALAHDDFDTIMCMSAKVKKENCEKLPDGASKKLSRSLNFNEWK